jgi:hypothetical protein
MAKGAAEELMSGLHIAQGAGHVQRAEPEGLTIKDIGRILRALIKYRETIAMNVFV